jgi:Sister chromatid cohesion C-terminus/PHD-finger/non-SMC mitotic condensation complex subunit 1/HEAT repeat associated with sister chromatid cohesion
VDLRLVDQQLQETLGLAQHFINEVCERAFKVRSDCQEYRVFLDSFIQDLLKLIYRPDFPIAYQMLNIITVKLFTGLKTYSAVIRHYIIDELSLVSSNLKSSIHDIKQSPIVPQNITKVPMTQHPSDNSMASICICNEGWSLDKSEMVQCEECWKWFHLDCVALDIEKYDDESWFCDDCRLFECLQHIEIIKPTIKDEELLALPKELIYINQQYQNVYRVLIINYLIANNNRLDESARSLWLSLWLQNNPSKALVELWQTPSKTPNLPRLSEKGTIKLLRQYLLSFDLGIIYLHIQHKIISLLNSPQPLTRAKAIKSLCSIVSADPECLVEDMIESAVTERLLDSSIAVREATVELLGKFITFKSEFSDNYYSALMERLKDKGPSVRKRVIKILKDIIESDPEHERIIEIYCEVVKRIGDDNESIREAVINMFEEVWFTTKPNKFFLSFVKIVKILKLKDPVVMLFKAILNKNEEHREKLEKITQIASEQLVASSNLKNSILYAKLLEIISLTSPELLVDQISTLHQFLTPVQNSNEESELLSSICIIIGRASEHLSSLNSTRIKRIESQLINLVYTQGSIVLTQALNALCKIVKLCSRNQKIIITLIERCFTLLLSSLQNPIEKKNLPSIYRALLALGVCIKFYDGDIYATLQLEKKKDFKTSLFDVYEKFAMQEDENLKERALDALSSTWVRFPDLLEKSDHLILKGWEMAKSPNSRIKMLQMFYEFLHHCDVNVLEGGDEDRGNVVSIIQKYLDNILDCAKNKSVEVRESAAEVLKLIYLQGQVDLSKMSSILFCMLVDESNIVKESGYFCLEKSFSKNSSIVILNLQNSLKESFEYQVDLFKSRSLSDSFYVKFYNLIKPKKSVRTKFLTQMTGLLEPTDPSFTEYLCDFLSVLPYTGLEEISPIISQITGKIQTSAFRLLRIIKVRTANKEPLDRENMIECLLQIQLIYLKNYLFNAYQLKGIEENTDKGIQKVEDINGFYEEYQEFKEYHELNQINCDDLCKFKKKVFYI